MEFGSGRYVCILDLTRPPRSCRSGWSVPLRLAILLSLSWRTLPSSACPPSHLRLAWRFWGGAAARGCEARMHRATSGWRHGTDRVLQTSRRLAKSRTLCITPSPQIMKTLRDSRKFPWFLTVIFFFFFPCFRNSRPLILVIVSWNTAMVSWKSVGKSMTSTKKARIQQEDQQKRWWFLKC